MRNNNRVIKPNVSLQVKFKKKVLYIVVLKSELLIAEKDRERQIDRDIKRDKQTDNETVFITGSVFL